MLRALAVVGLLLTPFVPLSPAHAERQPGVAAITLGRVQIPAGSRKVIGAAEFAKARHASHARGSSVSAAVHLEISRETAEVAAEHGVYVTPADVDVVSLFDGDVLVGVPTQTAVDSMTVAASEDGSEIEASLETSTPTSLRDTTVAGPGMALSWADNGGGSYVIKIYQNGDLKIDGRFTWKRRKLLGDSDASKVHYTYQRFGDAQPSAQTGPDPRVIRLRIQNFPFDQVEPYLRSWDRYSPGSDRSDNCNTYTASISYGGLGLSVPFDEGCGTYNMWRNVDKPSSYWLQYESGGLNPSGGNKQVGYVIMWSQQEGTPGSQHDLQQIRLGWPAYYWGAYETCTQTDASRTC